MKEIFKQNQFIIVFFVLITLSACGGNEVKPNSTPTSTPTSAPVSEQDIPKQNRTSLGLYYTSTQTFKLLSTEKERKNTLFLDVRTEEEYDNGTPTLVDDNVPMYNWDENKKYVSNPDFMIDFEDYLEGKGLNKESRIILICRTGNRSARAVDALAKKGYKKVYTVIDGTDGWKQNKLPWLD
jgi:rhodanese-related sulfurtransferase